MFDILRSRGNFSSSAFHLFVIAIIAGAGAIAGCSAPTEAVRDSMPARSPLEPAPARVGIVPPAPDRTPRYADWLFDGPEGRNFAAHLSLGYRRYAKLEDNAHDFANAARFLARAGAAERGETVEPEAISQRTLPAYAVDDLLYARQRLMYALNRAAAASLPKLTAQAQVMFDCWMEQQEENIQPQDVAACRGEFETAMARIEVALKEPPAPQAPATTHCAPAACPACVSEPAAAQASCPAAQLIYFEFDEASLTHQSEVMIADIAHTLAATPTTALMVTGHADQAGTDPYNDALSKQRLDAVLQALRDAGVPNSAFGQTRYFGKTQPRIPTPDGERNAENRRVEIHFVCAQTPIAPAQAEQRDCRPAAGPAATSGINQAK